MAFDNKVGSGFTNIQKYLGANQNNQLGSTINSGIQNQVKQTQNNLGSAQNEFQDQLNSNKYNVNEGQDLINGASTADNVSDDQAKRFQQLKAGMYTGPQNLNNAQQLQGQAQDTKQLGQATGTTAGRYGLLQKYAGRGQYNQGQQRLDNLILGQTGQQDLNQARRSTAGIDNQVSGAINVAGQQAGQAASNNQQVGQELGTALDTTNQGLVSAAQAQADALTKQRIDQYNDYDTISQKLTAAQTWLNDPKNAGKTLTDYLGQNYTGEQKGSDANAPANQLTADDLTKLGLNGDIFVNQLNPTDLINSIKSRSQAEQEAAVTAQQAATEDQANRAAALAKLSGGTAALTRDANGPTEFNPLARTDLEDFYKNTNDYTNRNNVYNNLQSQQTNATNALLRDIGAVSDPSGGFLGLGNVVPGQTYLTADQGQAAVKAIQNAMLNGNQNPTQALANILKQSQYKDQLIAQGQKYGSYGNGTPDDYFNNLAGQIIQRNSTTENGGVGTLAGQQAKFQKLSDLLGQTGKTNDVNKL